MKIIYIYIYIYIYKTLVEAKRFSWTINKTFTDDYILGKKTPIITPIKITAPMKAKKTALTIINLLKMTIKSKHF